MKNTVLILFTLVSLPNFCQTTINEKEKGVSSKDSIRYVFYENKKGNELLFEQRDSLGFYRLLQQTFSQLKNISNIEIRGIDTLKWDYINSSIKSEKIKNDDLNFKFIQNIRYRKAMNGEDSVNFLPDGTTQYITYQTKQDSIYFISKNYDALIIKELLVTDSMSEKQQFEPIEINLMRKIDNNWIRVAGIDFKFLYRFPKNLYTKLPDEIVSKKLKEYEVFLEQGTKRFGLSFLPNEFEFYRSSIEDPVNLQSNYLTKFTYRELVNLSKTNKDVVFIIKKREYILNDENGEITKYTDPQTKEILTVTEIRYDTSFSFVRNFHCIYQETNLYYSKDKKWTLSPTKFLISKKLFDNQKPNVVLEFDCKSYKYDVSLFQMKGSDFEINKTYYYDNNPLYKLCVEERPKILNPFQWETKLLSHKYSGKILSPNDPLILGW